MDKNLIDKFFRGLATEEEAKMVMQWYLSDKLEDEVAARLEKYWNKKITPDEWNVEKGFAGLTARLKGTDQDFNQEVAMPGRPFGDPGRRVIKPFFSSFMKVAASVILIIGAAFFSLQYFNSIQKGPELIVQAASKGERLTIILPDSSTAILNGESSITYEKNFSGKTREIELTGEAFFDVRKDPRHPFIVRAGNVSTTALGTSFSVQYYSQDKPDKAEQTFRVYLVSGKVKVHMSAAGGSPAKSGNVFLTAGEYAYPDTHAGLAKAYFSGEEVLWKDGILYFNSTPFREVLKKLEKWYGVNITVRNGDTNKLYSGEFTNESLPNVLESLSFSGGFQYQLSGDDVEIHFDK